MSHLTFTSQDKSTSGALMVHVVDAFSMVYDSGIMLQCMATTIPIRAFDKELNDMTVV
jgi:hypothetical protein